MECNLVARGGDGGDILKFSLRKWSKKTGYGGGILKIDSP